MIGYPDPYARQGRQQYPNSEKHGRGCADSCGRFNSGPAHHALKRKYSQVAGQGETLREPVNIRTCKSSPCKDVRTRGGERLPEQRDGFRIIRLVMSIIFLHIIISGMKDNGSGKGTGRVQTPSR